MSKDYLNPDELKLSMSEKRSMTTDNRNENPDHHQSPFEKIKPKESK